MRHSLPDDTTPVRNIRFHAPSHKALAAVSFEACIGDIWIGFRGWSIYKPASGTGTKIGPPRLRSPAGAWFSSVDLPENVRADIRAAIRGAASEWDGTWGDWADDTD